MPTPAAWRAMAFTLAPERIPVNPAPYAELLIKAGEAKLGDPCDRTLLGARAPS